MLVERVEALATLMEYPPGFNSNLDKTSQTMVLDRDLCFVFFASFLVTIGSLTHGDEHNDSQFLAICNLTTNTP